MALFLGDDVDLTVEDGLPYFGRRGSGVAHTLRLAEAVAVSLLAASGNRDKADNACAEVLGSEASGWVDHVVDRFWPFLGGTRPRPIKLDWLKSLDDRKLVQLNEKRPQAAPASVIWLVTLACNRRCPYCFYKITPYPAGTGQAPSDNLFRHDRVLKMLHDMSAVGTPDLYLTGGEPLLRPDLPELIEAATKLRLRTHLTTKYAVDRPLARRLSGAGLASLVFSLDDGRQRQADGLAGASGFYDEAVVALRAVVEAGLGPEVNAVATRVNITELGELARLLVDLGVPKLAVSPFISPYPARPSTDALMPSQQEELSQIVADLITRFGDRLAIEVGTAEAMAPDPMSNVEATVAQAVCDVGVRELHILPDGRSTRCRYLPEHPGLIVGSLNDQRLMEVWTGKRLASLTAPSRGDYQGTACSTCGAFESCNSRGRCYVSALQNAGRMNAPDAFCRMGSQL